MNRILMVLVFFVCCAATCGPLYTHLRPAGKPTIRDKEGQVTVSLEADDAHYSTGNLLTVYFKIVNTSKDTVYLRQLPPFVLRTQNFDLSAREGFVVQQGRITPAEAAAVFAVKPADSLKAFYCFSNNFRGSYKKFRNMLNNARLFINLKGITLNGKELQFEEQELVVNEKDITASAK